MPLTAKQALLNYAEFLKRSGYLYVETGQGGAPAAESLASSPASAVNVAPPTAGAARSALSQQPPPQIPARMQATGTAEAPLASSTALPAEAPAPPTASAPLPAGDIAGREAELARVAEQAAACRACVLCKGRRQVVFSDGPANARLMIVGEAPGGEEDAQGLPFVGPSGQLLNKMLLAIGFAREEVYICNTVKCRPPGNRDPLPGEKDACEPFLARQLELVQPALIIALGAHAAQYLCHSEASIGALRGRWHSYRNVPLRATYHPAFLLRSPDMKGRAWDDFKAIHARYTELRPQDPRKIWSK